MPKPHDRQYFIIKHDLESFDLRPGVIWRTNILPPKMPRGFRQIRKNDLWIQFAYINNEIDREACRLITGIYRCIREADFRRVPKDLLRYEFDWAKEGFNWDIIGKAFGKQPRYNVTVPHINELLGKKVVGRNTIIRISQEDFDHIRDETFRLELPPSKIPLLGREPGCEQEVLSIVIAGLDRLGIDGVLQVQVHFPDMLVKINGKEVWLELEVNSLDFQTHGHIEQLKDALTGKRKEAKRKDEDDNRPVALLCWFDNDNKRELMKQVRGLKIFELQSLLRSDEQIKLS